ncbi:MAG: hypothetical protein EON90_00575 [Brevundimonas sp.]|nr:MAG: hypothetical protein EON90_00575 [Brevundimonas sp.]
MLREKVFEHLFLGELTRTLLKSGRRCEVLRAEFDGSGFDVALEAEGVLRHVQLKAMRADGKRAHVDIHTALTAKPSGCVVWMLVDPSTFEATAYRWFGAPPGQPLPALGDKAVRHNKADSQGVKAERADLRQLGRGRFETIADMEGLIERLFGDERTRDVLALRAHLASRQSLPESASPWMRLVQHGVFDALPERVSELELIDLTHLADGYALAGLNTPERIQDALCNRRPDIGSVSPQPSSLWAAMFIEHRRLRFQDRALTAVDQHWFESAYRELRRLLLRLPPAPSRAYRGEGSTEIFR